MTRATQVEMERDLAGDVAWRRARDIVSAHLAHLVGKEQAVLLFGEIRSAAATADNHTPGASFIEAQLLPVDSRVAQCFASGGEQQRHRPPDPAEILRG